ncbi:hypothetical protein [Pseudoalteromonas denitrificans]|uniref:Lipoprotein n=1 Tax=Pseudoalteromonas denitrificans DSM 6059 TaxID=1123010 RepID=A0A1I1NSW6_9GAMM|nr:hypothetical protein [Pseudoalteromonas denitrificans]SFD00525.1 hypothetical protein SAMN02745724_03166 [Pseudoalteromonas denitrificans DSM 6059]
MIKIHLVLIISLILSGCSIHEMVNGDEKPGLAYVSIDKNGDVVSNNKGTAHFFETYEESLENTNSIGSKILEDRELLKSLMEAGTNRSTLFIWSAEYNGAMVDSKGNTCLQAATYAKTTNTSVDISSSLLNVLSKINLSSNPSEADKLIALSITQAITKLNDSTAQSTYLAAGLFGLCVLQANGGLQGSELQPVIKELIKASSLEKTEL